MTRRPTPWERSPAENGRAELETPAEIHVTGAYHSSGLSSRRKGHLRIRWLIILSVVVIFSSHCLQVLALTAGELNTIEVYEKVAPSVVNITTAVCELEFFFCATPTHSGSGSGIVLKEDGTIVTSHHVISQAETIEVTLADGRHLKATVIAAAPDSDLAIIRVDAGGRPLKAITLGDSDRLAVGEKVLAIGNPFGLGQTLSVGVVSMVGRSIRNNGLILRDLVQTSAAINPGNSGGALVNSEGELIGMNTAILSPTGSNVGIGFAIPVNHVKKVAPHLIGAWGRPLGWALAALLVIWMLRRIYRPVKRGTFSG